MGAMRVYRLRLRLEASDLILDFREQGSEAWLFAAARSFPDPADAHKRFDALRALKPPAYGVLETFKDWNCILPPELRGSDQVVLMGEHDFVEP